MNLNIIYTLPILLIVSLFIYVLINSSYKLEMMLREQESSKLTQKHYEVIQVMNDHPDFMTMEELSHFTKIDIEELKSILDSLVHKRRVLLNSESDTYAINRKDIKSHYADEYDKI